MNQQEALKLCRDALGTCFIGFSTGAMGFDRDSVAHALAATAPDKIEPDRVADGVEAINEREAFERWYANGDMTCSSIARNGENYKLMQTMQAWITWQHAWKSALAQPTVKDSLQVADGWISEPSTDEVTKLVIKMLTEDNHAAKYMVGENIVMVIAWTQAVIAEYTSGLQDVRKDEE